ncbi:MAG: hypothetical protein CME13_10515, partial [Gemmatimonadetes bacterium]|nr:hypothetical protein [Gemmatimonadota bacterium]
MSEAELNRMVEELNGARLGLQRLTTWRRFQLSVEIETPSMIARFAQRINERTLPPSYVPSDPQQARELLLPSVTSN